MNQVSQEATKAYEGTKAYEDLELFDPPSYLVFGCGGVFISCKVPTPNTKYVPNDPMHHP